MKVALVHDWLVTMGGAERVLETLAHMYPDAPIYTGVLDRSRLSPYLQQRTIYSTFVQRLPRAKRWYNRYLPLLMYGFEQFDLSRYDLVISSSAAIAKGVLTRAETVHVSYIHTPMRYAWDLYHDYHNREAKGLTRRLMGPVFHYVRLWDRLSADRADVLVANSHTVQQRIRKHYRRSAEVVFPPVNIDRFQPAPHPGDYYLVLSRLVAYKRVDLAIEAANALGIKLVVAGDGPERERLARLASRHVEFVGAVDDEKASALMTGAKGLIFPGEEDFGIVPVEMQAAGRPVIAYGQGGVKDTVIDGKTGVFFDRQEIDAVIAAIRRAETITWDSQAIRQHTEQFRPAVFETRMAQIIQTALDGR
ncbi:MAG: glycosyltransferase family 4 protein [Sulfobacillus thermosulfidooxidans]|uniref:Glycosyl transferase n=1 Tax=Sulfobacillus thermotolerans TaxID=338644 RepID=A0ABN5H6I5_9FIRM|nr:glycosyltransferase [Sulfobacillus sp. hq2]AUW95078.1 glycosyl transferase [Sulfobacillus thermotolerans]POB10316.1 glycosyl transferase [Sulfobacillus sp. hq2]PSR32413.1 MAG: glycosyltransferase family 4 protein [Sulfobacillus thermosulfidooxidans]